MTGKELKQRRKKHGLSLSKAAALVGVTPRTWARWEKLDSVPNPGAELFVLKTGGK